MQPGSIVGYLSLSSSSVAACSGPPCAQDVVRHSSTSEERSLRSTTPCSINSYASTPASTGSTGSTGTFDSHCIASEHAQAALSAHSAQSVTGGSSHPSAAVSRPAHRVAGSSADSWYGVPFGVPVYVSLGDAQCALYSCISSIGEAGMFTSLIAFCIYHLSSHFSVI